MDSDSESFVPVFASQSKKRKLLFADQEPPDRARQFLTQKPEEWLGPISSFSASAAPSGPQNQQQQSLQLPDHSDDDDFYQISLHQVDLDDEIGQQVVSPSDDDEEQLQPQSQSHTKRRTSSVSAAAAPHARPTDLDDEFKCNIGRCEKTFSAISSLNRHIREHSGDRPHTCQFCGNSFVQKSSIKKHIRTQHPGVQPDQPGAQSGGYQFMHSIYFNHCF